MQGLFTLSKLRILDLSHLFLTDDIAARFAVLTELTEVNVSHCRDLTNAGAMEILRACPKLHMLVVTGCPLSTLGMMRLHRNRRNLQTWAVNDVRCVVANYMFHYESLPTHMSPNPQRVQEEDNPPWLQLCQNVLFIHAGSVYKLRAFQVPESNMVLTGLVSVGMLVYVGV